MNREGDLLETVRRMVAAEISGDVGALEEILAPDYRGADSARSARSDS